MRDALARFAWQRRHGWWVLPRLSWRQALTQSAASRLCSLRSNAQGDTMRLLLATLSHETNTFSPVPTKLERFCRDGASLLTGQAAIDF